MCSPCSKLNQDQEFNKHRGCHEVSLSCRCHDTDISALCKKNCFTWSLKSWMTHMSCLNENNTSSYLRNYRRLQTPRYFPFPSAVLKLRSSLAFFFLLLRGLALLTVWLYCNKQFLMTPSRPLHPRRLPSSPASRSLCPSFPACSSGSSSAAN